MPSKKLKTPLLADTYYHIYNRGNNREKIFLNESDYLFFLAKYHELIVPFSETYAFCLLPNHFHFLIKTRPEVGLNPSVVSNQLRKLFIAHSKRINDLNRRTGSLFTKNFQRIEIKDENYLKSLVRYIHLNPRKHGVSNDFHHYNFSSFRYFQGEELSWLSRSVVYDWFGSKEDFLDYHSSEGNGTEIQTGYFLEPDGVQKK